MVAFPPYTAVRLCEPVAAKAVAKVATPALTEAVPSEAAPSLKVTIPVGLEPVTVALNVVLCVATDGLTLEVSTVVVGAGGLTVCVKAAEVLVALATLPP